MEPVTVFNKDIWEKIVQYLSTEEKLNLTQTCPWFNETFEDKKSEWQFSTVLPVLFKNFEGFYGFKGAWKASLFNCRLVTSSCYKSMDNYVKEFWDRNESLGYPQGLNMPPILNTQQKILNFCDKVKNFSHNRSPIFTRGLILTICGSYYKAEAIDSTPLFRTVERFGTHLYILELSTISFSNVRSLLKCLQRLLSNLPNLRSLGYCLYPTVDVEKITLTNQSPTLQHLKKLTLLKEGNIVPLIPYIQVATYFLHLTYLHLDYCFWKGDYNVQGIFPNLQYLSLDRISILEKGVQEDLVDVLRSIDIPQLKILSLQLQANSSFTAMDNSLASLEETGVSFFKIKYPHKRWKSQNGELLKNKSERLMYLKIYDENTSNGGICKPMSLLGRCPNVLRTKAITGYPGKLPKSYCIIV